MHWKRVYVSTQVSVCVHINLFLDGLKYTFWADYIAILEWGTCTYTSIYIKYERRAKSSLPHALWESADEDTKNTYHFHLRCNVCIIHLHGKIYVVYGIVST